MHRFQPKGNCYSWKISINYQRKYPKEKRRKKQGKKRKKGTRKKKSGREDSEEKNEKGYKK